VKRQDEDLPPVLVIATELSVVRASSSCYILGKSVPFFVTREQHMCEIFFFFHLMKIGKNVHNSAILESREKEAQSME